MLRNTNAPRTPDFLKLGAFHAAAYFAVAMQVIVKPMVATNHLAAGATANAPRGMLTIALSKVARATLGYILTPVFARGRARNKDLRQGNNPVARWQMLEAKDLRRRANFGGGNVPVARVLENVAWISDPKGDVRPGTCRDIGCPWRDVE